MIVKEIITTKTFRGRIARISYVKTKVFAIMAARRGTRCDPIVTRVPRRLIRILSTSGAEGYSGDTP
jgi:hypothetical protein